MHYWLSGLYEFEVEYCLDSRDEPLQITTDFWKYWNHPLRDLHCSLVDLPNNHGNSYILTGRGRSRGCTFALIWSIIHPFIPLLHWLSRLKWDTGVGSGSFKDTFTIGLRLLNIPQKQIQNPYQWHSNGSNDHFSLWWWIPSLIPTDQRSFRLGTILQEKQMNP